MKYVLIALLLWSCKSTSGDSPTANNQESDVKAVPSPAWPASSMARTAIMMVAIPAIAEAGAAADYRNCHAHGCEGIDGLCYDACAPGYEFMSPFVSRCFEKNGSGRSYDRGRGKMYCYQGISIDPPEHYQRNCESNGCEYTRGLCYRRCPEGWVVSATEPTSCTKPCPPYYNDTGGTCFRGIHPVHSITKLPRHEWFVGRGAGAIGCRQGVPQT